MAEVKKIKIFVEEKTSTDGRKFNVYRTVTKNGVKITAKFRKDVRDLPTEDCFAHILVDNMNMQKNAEYPTLWISAVEKYEPIAAKFDSAANAKEIAEIFG